MQLYSFTWRENCHKIVLYILPFQFAKKLKGDDAKLHKMVQMSWTFVNDSLCTTLCLQWEPEIIAIAVMYLAAKLSKFEVSRYKKYISYLKRVSNITLFGIKK